jgi:hypothetical protein
MRPLAVYLLLVGALAAIAGAQPAAVTRTLRTIDFEERRMGNVEDVPMNWVKLEGSGLPHYVNARLVNDLARSGDTSFRFDLNGGSLVYRYSAGHIPVQRGAHYRVDAWVRTTPLRRARARVTAYLADSDGVAIPGTLVHSELYAARTGDEAWKKLSAEISVSDPAAASLVIEIGLLQPQRYRDRELGDRTLLTQDIRGSAWFDDITVAQVPKVSMHTLRAGNVHPRGEPVQLVVNVNDRFVDDLAGRLVVRDASGREVYQRSGALDLADARDVGPGQRRIALALPELPAGWYEASLVLSSHGQPVGEQTLGFVCLADAALAVEPDRRFGIVATSLPHEGWRDLPELLSILGAGRVKLSLWNGDNDIDVATSSDLDRLLETLHERGIAASGCLVDLPQDVASKVGGGEWPRLLRAPLEAWQPSLAYLVSRHARRIDGWQLGDDADASRYVETSEMHEVYRLVHGQLAQLLMQPNLAIPWPAWYELPGGAPQAISLLVPPEVLPSQVPLYLAEFARVPGRRLNVTLAPLSRDRYGREVQIRDLAQRFAHAIAAGAQRIDLPLPFAVRRDGEQVLTDPSELLLVARTLMGVLGNTTFRGKVPIAEGVEAMLFERDGRGLLMIWTRSDAVAMQSLAVNLGAAPRRIDLWGNVTPLAAVRDGEVKVEVGPVPVFLIDIDGRQAQLRSSVAVDNPLLESSFKPHTRKLRFTNPYSTAISGTLRIAAPSGWTISAQNPVFALNPGETYEQPVTIEFPYNSFAGARTVNVEFRLQGESDARFVVPLELRLGLSDVGLQTIALRDGDDVVVQQMITNYGNQPISYTAFAMFPGQARQERLVTNLGPGHTTVKKYRFANADVTDGARVRSGVRELEGVRVLNDVVEIQ